MTDFENKIGYEFKDKNLLARALTHSSYANEKGTGLDNERLEFLGDAVLGMVTCRGAFILRTIGNSCVTSNSQSPSRNV